MPELPAWRIYYDNDTTFSSLDGEPHEAPSEGFICCVAYNQQGNRYIMHKWDFYCYDLETEQWWGMNLPGLFDRLRRNLVYAYKEGRTLDTPRYQEIFTRADHDLDFPVGGRK